MDEISGKLTELESEWNASAPNHLPRGSGPIRQYGRMICGRIVECRESYDWATFTRDRLARLINLRTLGDRYGVSYQTVYRYIDHSIGSSHRCPSRTRRT
jgi:hypothetical protein